MSKRKSIFVQMNLIILLLLLPILFLYAYTNKVNLKVIEDEIVRNNENQLVFLKDQIDNIMNRFTFLPSIFLRDSTVLNFQKTVLTKDYYAMTQYKPILEEKLYLQSYAVGPKNELTLYLPDIRMRISTDKNETYRNEHFEHVKIGKWAYHEAVGQEDEYFDFYFTDPWKTDIERVNAVFETKIYGSGIRSMLETYKGESSQDPFLVTDKGQIIASNSGNLTLLQNINKKLQTMVLADRGHTELTIDGEKYLIFYEYIPMLGVYLVDSSPLENVISPIIKSRNLFYACIILLVIVSFLQFLLLYRYVQIPILLLTRALKAMEMGDYSYKISKKFHNEFDFLLYRFNEMAAQIRHLIENVYEEQNRARISTLKQLQSQINPHFLYNCLSFIAGSAKIGMNQSAMDMSYSLADYFRYTTRVENQSPSLKEEIDLLKTYLDIYQMRLERLTYTIDIPEAMLLLKIPRLILQPVVENAVLHGIEPKLGHGRIIISGKLVNDEAEITIKDDGVGMTNEDLAQLLQKLNNRQLEENMSYGLWNINQRFKHRFGNEAGIAISQISEQTGLCVLLKWNIQHDKGDQL